MSVEKKHKEIRKALYPRVDEIVPALLEYIEGNPAPLEAIRKRRYEVKLQYPEGAVLEPYKPLAGALAVAQPKKSFVQKLKELFQ